MTDAGAYPGGELALFQHARNWKRYVAERLSPWLAGAVVEAGAGLGATTRALVTPAVTDWLCLEPDPDMAARLADAVAGGALPAVCRARHGVMADLAKSETFDVALYVDVLEHIADDAAELARAAQRLRPGGRILVLSPAHQWLYSPFDAAIGHFRRYARSDGRALTPAGMALETAVYLDCVGLAASAANRFVLRSAMPSQAQVLLWDRLMAPVSRVLDPLTGGRLGKSVLFVWRKG